jgi:hypothetical protein
LTSSDLLVIFISVDEEHSIFKCSNELVVL